MKNLLLACLATILILGWSACQNDAAPKVEKPAPTATADTVVGFKGCDHAAFTPVGAGSFDYTYQHYTVRVLERSDTLGHGIVVAPHRGGPHFTVPMPDDGYFMGVNRDYLFVDAGTGPDGREMIIFDLPGQHEVFREKYCDEVEIISNGKVWFWAPVEASAIDSLPACADSATWLKNGLSIGYGQRKIFDPVSRVYIAKSEYKCVPLQ